MDKKSKIVKAPKKEELRAISTVEERSPRKPGLWKGKIFVPDNFDDEDEEFNKLFYEGEVFPNEK